MDDRVYELRLDGNDNPAGGYTLTTNGAVKSLAVGHDAYNRPELFTTGLDDQVWAEKLDANGSSAGPYFLTSPGRVLSVKVGQDAYGDPELFILGLDSQLYTQKFDANGSPVTDYFLTALGQVPIVAFERGGNSRLRHRELPGPQPPEIDRQERRAIPAAGREGGKQREAIDHKVIGRGTEV